MPQSPTPPGARPLYRGEKLSLGLFLLAAAAFGVVVELRSAFQWQRKTDFGVYARAAWAVRAGEDLYEISDDRGWHYCYPPPFAVLMAPFADPPASVTDRTGYLPFAWSVGIWYVLSVVCAGYAVHALAAVAVPDAPPGTRRWWYARTVPFYVCVGGIGMTLSRGQVNTLVLAFVAAMFAAAVRGRPGRSGAWLAAAVCLKVIPALLATFPAVRREPRAAVGLALGLVVGLGLIPSAVWGVGGAVSMNLTMANVVLRPGATGGGDQTRAKELTNAGATDSQSFQAVLHALRHPDSVTRPKAVDPEARLAHAAICGTLLAATLFAGLRAPRDPASQLIVFGGLCVVMLLATPVSHMHYYAMALPLVAGLWAKGLAARPGDASAGPVTLSILVAWAVLTAVPLFPYPVTSWLRDVGLGTFSTVGLWAFGMWSVGGPACGTAVTAAPARSLATAA